jgi:pyruvate/2-oxoglutarate dehydrogenase complex dihydrolipoamide acyltransferase (E2) component
MLLALDLQMFGEDDDLDIDSMLAEFEEEWDDEESAEDVSEETEETEEVEEVSESEEQEEPEVNPNDEDADKRNRAFADLRRENEANRKYANFIQRLAEEGGVSPDDLLARYEERNLQAEAQRQQVPVELLKRQNATESELHTLKEQMRAERIDAQINSVTEKYGADDDSIRETFKYMVETGIDPRIADNVDFEKFYRAANLDTIIQNEVKTARQRDLEDKKKRQESASIGNGKSVSPSSGDLSDDDFESIMKSLDMRL